MPKPTRDTPKEPEQEPDDLTIAYMAGLSRGKDLAPQRKPWVSLSREQIKTMYQEHGIGGLTDYEFAEAIETKLRELNEAPQRKPLTDGWVSVTKELLNEQESWLYKTMWIAAKNGDVLQGYYEWQQRRNPDRFITVEYGDIWAFDATHVMPIHKPELPAAHGIKGDA